MQGLAQHLGLAGLLQAGSYKSYLNSYRSIFDSKINLSLLLKFDFFYIKYINCNKLNECTMPLVTLRPVKL